MRKRNPNTRYKEVCVRLTDAEYKELVWLCSKTGMTKPDVLRKRNIPCLFDSVIEDLGHNPGYMVSAEDIRKNLGG